jgi:hypothetical protein
MTLVSVVVGLGLTHALGALGGAVHRLRGNGEPIRLEAIYLLWLAFVLVWLVSFWWWEYKLHEIAIRWTYGIYLFILGYATLLFLTVVILVPRNMAGIHDTYVHFMSVRRWFFSALVTVNVFDVADSALKSWDWALRPDYLAQVGIFMVGAIIGMRSESRTVQLWNAVLMFALQIGYTWVQLDILGTW